MGFTRMNPTSDDDDLFVIIGLFSFFFFFFFFIVLLAICDGEQGDLYPTESITQFVDVAARNFSQQLHVLDQIRVQIRNPIAKFHLCIIFFKGIGELQ